MSSRRRQQSFVKETNSHFSQPHNELLGSPFHSHSDRSSNYSSSPNPNDVKLNHSPRLSLHSPRVSRFPLYREEQKVERLPSPTLDFVDTVTDINNNLSNENLSLEDKESQETQYSLFLSQPSSLSIPPIRNVDQASQLSSPSYISNSTNNSYKSSGQTYNGKIRTPPTTYPKTFSSPNSSERSISDESYHSIQESFKVTNERIVAVSPTQPPRMIETPLKAVEFSPADTIVPKATPELSPGFNLATIQVPKLRSAAQISHNQSPQLSSTVSITPKQVPQLSPAISYSPSLSVTPSSNTSITTKVSSRIASKESIKNRFRRLSVYLSNSNSNETSPVASNDDYSPSVKTLSRRNSLTSLIRKKSITSSIKSPVVDDIPKTSYYETAAFDIDSYNNNTYSLSSPSPDSDISSSPKFWKYHVFQQGKEFYVTTNPTMKHAYCLQGPSYFIEITYPEKYKKPTASGGFTLTFKSLEDIGTNKAPRMVITKRDDLEGGHYTISIPLLNKAIVSPNKKSPFGPSIFNGLALPKQVDSQLSDQDPNFINYELKDIMNDRWNIGSIPKIDKYNSHAHKFIYFHQNYIEKSNHNTYNFGNSPSSGSKIPPVIAVFRPNRRRVNIINTVSRAKLKSKIDSLIKQQQNVQALIRDQNSNVHTTNYYSCEDGLYNRKNPTDDQPDDSKLGWITIYEDNELLRGGKQRKDSFDLVLGLLLAVAYENSLS